MRNLFLALPSVSFIQRRVKADWHLSLNFFQEPYNNCPIIMVSAASLWTLMSVCWLVDWMVSLFVILWIFPKRARRSNTSMLLSEHYWFFSLNIFFLAISPKDSSSRPSSRPSQSSRSDLHMDHFIIHYQNIDMYARRFTNGHRQLLKDYPC